MYNFQLSEERRQFQEMARKFAENEVKPLNDKFDDDWETHRYMPQVLKKAAELGFMGLTIDPKFGGTGADGMTTMAILEELAAVNGGVACVIGDTWFAQTPIIIAANNEQRERFLRPLASREEVNLGCICMTEPASGADIEDSRMRLRTVKTIIKEDGNDYIINGIKIWPSNAGIASHYIVIATTDPKLEDKGSCIIVVEKDTPGLSFGKIERKMGMPEDQNREVIFEDVRVPKSNLLGKIGDGHRLLHTTVAYNRLGAGMISVGIARGAFEYALGYCKGRVVGGKPLIKHSLISAMFADMATKIDAARLLVYRASWSLKAKDHHRARYSDMAKVFATNMAMEITSNCVQVMGSYGYSKEYPVEKYMRDAKIVQIYLGPNEMLQQLIGESL
ncbi:MAG: acyl-CoA dehydrogenase family protein [Thermodesulfobacteriota bacterium]|nr:acyl-CoA dehydrogenase family protein [Thermodesulfobacteriota bacterium]